MNIISVLIRQFPTMLREGFESTIPACERLKTALHTVEAIRIASFVDAMYSYLYM
jgi:hypothetical protein